MTYNRTPYRGWETSPSRPGRRLIFAVRLVWLLTWVIILLLLVRFALKLFGADPASRLAGLVYDLTFPLLTPFFALLPTPEFGPIVIEAFTLIAVVCYVLLGTAIAKAIELFIPPRTG